MKKHTKAFALVAASLTLAACGGGGSGGGGGAPSNLVEGDFFYASSTGASYPDDNAGNGQFGQRCTGEDHYFETKDGRIRVYGSTSYSVTDFRVVATHIDKHLDPVLTRFGMTWDEFVDQRQLLTSDSMEELLKFQLNEDGSIQDPSNPSTSDAAVTFPIWAAMSTLDRLGVIEQITDTIRNSPDYGVFVGEEQIPDLQYRDKVIGCLNPNMGGGSFGEGTRHGIAVPPNTGSYPGSASTMIKHELVHFVQENMTRTGGTAKTLPRWFAEGQAIVFAGQGYHHPSRHYDYSPVDVVSPGFETIPANEAYKHYGLAYSYLDKYNTTENMTNIMWLMRDDSPNPLNQNYGDGVHAPGFINGFDSGMLDHEGNPLTFADYKANYHDIMNTQY